MFQQREILQGLWREENTTFLDRKWSDINAKAAWGKRESGSGVARAKRSAAKRWILTNEVRSEDADRDGLYGLSQAVFCAPLTCGPVTRIYIVEVLLLPVADRALDVQGRISQWYRDRHRKSVRPFEDRNALSERSRKMIRATCLCCTQRHQATSGKEVSSETAKSTNSVHSEIEISD